jgi:hypothetical protein
MRCVVVAGVLTALSGMALAQEDSLGSGTKLVRGRSYILPKVTLCVKEEAARELVARLRRDWNPPLPDGCAVREGDEFIPDRKLTDASGPVQQVRIHADGKELCIINATRERVHCDSRIVTYGIVVGRVKLAGDKYVWGYVHAHDDITVVD